MVEKNKESKEKKKRTNTAIIVYHNDDGKKVSDFCTIIEKNTSTVIFKNNRDTVIELPWFRVLKIKYREFDESKAHKYGGFTTEGAE